MILNSNEIKKQTRNLSTFIFSSYFYAKDFLFSTIFLNVQIFEWDTHLKGYSQNTYTHTVIIAVQKEKHTAHTSFIHTKKKKMEKKRITNILRASSKRTHVHYDESEQLFLNIRSLPLFTSFAKYFE